MMGEDGVRPERSSSWLPAADGIGAPAGTRGPVGKAQVRADGRQRLLCASSRDATRAVGGAERQREHQHHRGGGQRDGTRTGLSPPPQGSTGQGARSASVTAGAGGRCREKRVSPARAAMTPL